MKLRKAIAALALVGIVPIAAACSATSATESDSAATTSTTQTSSNDSDGRGGGRGNSVDVGSVATEAALVELIQEAYGDGSLDLHRGHQPVQDVLDEVLGISHDELHVRMEEQGQNLAAVAEDLGIDPQVLIDALVESWSAPIDEMLAAGTITADQASAYEEALTEAFTFRVNWDGEAATPTFAGLEG